MKAKEELNKKTSLVVDYEPIKSGRKAVGIRFFVTKKEQEAPKTVQIVQANRDEILDELIDLMHDDFKLREIREIAEAADYDISKVKKAYEYMQNYGTDIDVPIAFIKDCIKKGYYNTESRSKSNKSNSFNNFTQRNDYDFEELERKLLEN